MINELKAYVLEGDTVGSYVAFCAALGGGFAALLIVSAL